MPKLPNKKNIPQSEIKNDMLSASLYFCCRVCGSNNWNFIVFRSEDNVVQERRCGNWWCDSSSGTWLTLDQHITATNWEREDDE